MFLNAGLLFQESISSYLWETEEGVICISLTSKARLIAVQQIFTFYPPA